MPVPRILLVLALLLASCGHGRLPATPTALGGDLEVRPLADGVWLHVSTKELPGIGRYPSNGLVVLAPGGAILIDTPWTEDQTRLLLAWAEARQTPIRAAIVTHAHDDRMGGVGVLRAAGVPVTGLALTAARAPAAGLTPPDVLLDGEVTPLRLLGEDLEVFYPGPAHAPDNVVVWLPRAGVLVGGCMVKPADATSLGNVADADVPGWRTAIAKVAARYPAARVVVPGHGAPGGAELLGHTAALVDDKLK
jgi:metallo-beta-lactamase class B